MSLRKSAVKGLLWSFVESWGRQGVSSLIFLLLARFLAPETFGLVALSDLFVSFMRLFVDQGFAQAIVQKEDLEDEHLDSAFWISLVLGVLLTVLSTPVAYLAASLYEEPKLVPIIIVISFGFVFISLSSVHEAVLSRNFAFKSLAIRSFIAILASGIVGVSLAYYGFGVWSIVGQQLSYGAISTLTLWFASSWRPKLRFSLSHAKELLQFGLNIVGFKIVDYFGLKADNMLVGYFLGPVQLGYYVVAYKLLLVMRQLLISVISKVALPVFSRIQNEPQKLRAAFYNVTQLSSFCTFPIFVGASVLSPEIVKAVLGEQWLPSSAAMEILLLLGPLHAISYYNSSIILAKGRPDLRLHIQIVNVIVSIIGFVLVVRFGIVAMALCCVVCGYLVFPLSILAVHKLIKIDFKKYLTQYIGPLTGSAVMAIVIHICTNYLEDITGPYSLLALCSIVGSVSYLPVAALFTPNIFGRFRKLTKHVYEK